MRPLFRVLQRLTVAVLAIAAPSEPINPADVSVAAAAAAGRDGTSDSSVWLCSSIARVRSKIELYSMQCCRKSCRSPASWKTCRPSRAHSRRAPLSTHAVLTRCSSRTVLKIGLYSSRFEIEANSLLTVACQIRHVGAHAFV